MALRAQKLHAQQRHQLAAWHVCHVINLVSKRRITMSDLVPSLKKKGPRVFTPEAYGGNVAMMMAAIERARQADELAAEEEALHERG